MGEACPTTGEDFQLLSAKCQQSTSTVRLGPQSDAVLYVTPHLSSLDNIAQ